MGDGALEVEGLVPGCSLIRDVLSPANYLTSVTFSYRIFKLGIMTPARPNPDLPYNPGVVMSCNEAMFVDMLWEEYAV